MLMSAEWSRTAPIVVVHEFDDAPVDWYAVLTKPGREDMAEINLLAQDYRCFAPKRLVEVRHARRREMVKRPFYPRYVFAGVLVGLLEVGPIYSTRGVTTVLHDSRGPLRIKREAMASIMKRADRDGVIEINEKAPPEHSYAEGQVVGFKSESVWSAYTGTIDRVDSNGRIKLWIESGGHHRLVDVHHSELQPPN